jgi:hypothetical protein
MEQPLPILLENSIQIAWDYLERDGEIDDAPAASRFLSNNIENMIRGGERHCLVLSNRAITTYQRFKQEQQAA